MCVSVVTPEATLKPSSLHQRVRERQEKAEKHQTLLTSLPAHTTPVPSLTDLRAHCGNSHYLLSLLLMLEAALYPRLTPAKQRALLQEALASLLQIDNEQGHPPNVSNTSQTPPPPLLLSRTHTTMTFSPAPWNPPHTQQVSRDLTNIDL